MLTACAHCHRRFVVKEESVGRAARCTYCSERFLIKPHFSEELNLRGDEEELARSLNLPTLEDIEECIQPPDVQPGSAETERQPITLPAFAPLPQFEYLEGQRTGASLLLILWLAALGVYGIWAAGAVPSAATAAKESFGIDVPLDHWTRVWKPLLSKAGLMLIVVGLLFWAGAYVAARVMRMRYRTAGLLESCAIVSVAMTLPLLAVVAFGTTDSRVTMPATMAAFPAICLLVPALFGMPLAKGLTTAVICIGIAAPGYLLVNLWTASMQSIAVQTDDARIAKVIERKKQQLAENPATQPVKDQSAAMARVNALAAELDPARVLRPAPATTVPVESNVPPIPPAVQVPGYSDAPKAPVVSERVAELANAPANVPPPAPAYSAPRAQIPLPAPTTTPPGPLPTPSPLRIWREAGSPQQVIWPATPGSAFATVRLDQFGNHLLEFWATETLQRRGTLRLGGGAGVSYAICPSGETLVRVVNGASPVVEIWSLVDGSRKTQIPLTAEQLDARALGFFDKQLFGILVRQGPDASVDVFDIKRSAVRRRITWQVLSSGSSPGECTPENVAISPDGKHLAIVDSSARLALVDIAIGVSKKSWQLNLPRPESADVTSITFSPDGSLLAVLLDESQSANRSALFCGPVQSMELAAISFGDPAWRQAGCPRTPGKRVGRAIDWISDHELLMYGELVLNANAGTIMSSVHDHAPGFAGAAFGQYRLPDGSFLLQGFPDPQGRQSPLQRLRPETLASNGASRKSSSPLTE